MKNQKYKVFNLKRLNEIQMPISLLSVTELSSTQKLIFSTIKTLEDSIPETPIITNNEALSSFLKISPIKVENSIFVLEHFNLVKRSRSSSPKHYEIEINPDGINNLIKHELCELQIMYKE